MKRASTATMLLILLSVIVKNTFPVAELTY